MDMLLEQTKYKKGKFTMKKILATVMAVVMMLAVMPITYAYETVEIDGYSEGVPQLKVTNIIGKDEFLSRPDQYGNTPLGYVCQAPVTVELAAESMFMFEGRQCVPVGDVLKYSVKELPVEGFVEIGEYNEETKEYTYKTVPYTEELAWEHAGFVKGSKMTITKPGLYWICGRYEAVSGAAEVYLNVKGEAKPNASKVYVDGKEMEFDAYNIADNNYFKIRDIAMAINGSEKQYNVTWDNEKKAINLLKNTPYTVAGGELSKGAADVMPTWANTSHTLLDGELVGFASYTIGESNYYMLRDLGEVFDFSVEWDAATNSIHVDTTKSYVQPE